MARKKFYVPSSDLDPDRYRAIAHILNIQILYWPYYKHILLISVRLTIYS